MNGTKYLQIFICYHERVLLFIFNPVQEWIYSRKGWNNCWELQQQPCVQMNLWKGVIWRPHKIKTTFRKPQTDFYLKWYPNIRNHSSSLIWGRFLSRKSLIYLKWKITGDSVGRFIFKCTNLGTIVSIYDYQNYISKVICISVTQQNDTYK